MLLSSTIRTVQFVAGYLSVVVGYGVCGEKILLSMWGKDIIKKISRKEICIGSSSLQPHSYVNRSYREREARYLIIYANTCLN